MNNIYLIVKNINNEILVTTKFYKKLIKEDNIFDIKYNCIKETYNLKNFGKTICYRYLIK